MRRAFSVVMIILLCLSIFSIFPPQLKASGSSLAGFWKFDEGSGNIAVDSSDNGNTGTLHGGVAWVNGKYGKALDFNGVDGYVQIPPSNSLNIVGALTLEAWVYPRDYHSSAGADSHIVSRCNQYGGATYLFGTHAPNVGYAVNPDPIGVSNAVLSLNTWTYLTMTYDTNNVRLYINGQFDSSYQDGWSFIWGEDNWLAIGCKPPAYGEPPPISNIYAFFNGMVDEVRIYSRALSQPEIQTDMNSGAAYSVSFSESGLTQGTQWSVTFNGQTQSSTSNSITFSAANGVYPFSITPPTGYTASPSSGSATVNGADVTEPIIFSSPARDFEVSVSPSTTASPRAITSFTVTVTSVNGFSSPVMLNAVVDSAELTATFSSPTVTPPADKSTLSTMKVSVLSTQLKIHTILVYGISGATSHFVSVTLEMPFLSVPYYSQGDTGWCVPTSVAMIAKYYGISAHPWDVAVALNEPHNPLVGPGETPPISASFVLNYLSGVGLSGTEKAVDFNEIKALLDANEPVLIVLGPPVNHAFVITGYLYSGLGTDYYVFINDPSGYMIQYLNSHGQSYSYTDPYIQDMVFWSDIDNAIGNHKYVSYVIGVLGNGHIPGSATGALSLVGGGNAFSQIGTKSVSFKHPNSVSNGNYIVSDVYIWESGWLVSNDNSGDTQGLTWRRSPSHLLEIDPADNLSTPAGSYLIVNPTDKSQTYYFELMFSKDGVQKWTSNRLAITVAQCSHADQPLASDLNMYADILKSEYGLYIIKLLLYTSPAGGVPIDEIDLPPISYVALLNPRSLLTYNAHCPVYLDLYDEHGNCVGYNKTSGTVENQIDAAYWESNQTIFVFNPSGTYRLEATGTDNGTYELKTSYQDLAGTTIIISDLNGTITENETQVFDFGANANVTLTNLVSKSVVGQNLTSQVNATVADLGGPSATFDVSLYANGTLIGTQSALNLSGWSSTAASFTWNTTGLAYGNYTLTASMQPANNNFTCGCVFVAGVGDLTGNTTNLLDFVPDGKVDMKDVGIVARFFNQNVPAAPSNCDIIGPTSGVPDGRIDMRDIGLVARNFGNTYYYP